MIHMEIYKMEERIDKSMVVKLQELETSGMDGVSSH